jgi:hypothetical protein
MVMICKYVTSACSYFPISPHGNRNTTETEIETMPEHITINLNYIENNTVNDFHLLIGSNYLHRVQPFFSKTKCIQVNYSSDLCYQQVFNKYLPRWICVDRASPSL